MTKPKDRSRSKRKKYVRTPGGVTKAVYSRRKKTKRHYSAITHQQLKGVSNDMCLNKSKRKPSRIYGGNLSPGEVKTIIKYTERIKTGMMKIDEVDIKFRKYIEARLKE